MTAFETATLAFQTATLAFQEAQLALQAWQLWAALAIPAVGIVQTAVVAWGIRAMIRANNRRTDTDQRRAEFEQRRAETEQRRIEFEERRAETEQRRIEFEERRAESEERRVEIEQHRADAEVARHAESMEALRAIIQGLEVVIERTGGRA